MIALLSLTTPSTWAQTTVTLPAACQNCPATTSPSTNGTAVVSNYGDATCANPSSGTINGTMTEGTAVSGVTMSLYANVTTLGTYNLSATQNGVTFSGTGTFTALGCQLITLTASGTPTAAGPFTWCTNTTPQGCSPATVAPAGPAYPAGYVPCDGVTTVVQDVMSASGKIWMDRNLGASRAAVVFDDIFAFGDLYQWGRFAEGHQCRTSTGFSGIATTAVPNAGNTWDGKLVYNNAFDPYANDWLTPSNNNLWQGVNGTNNPCPSGYRLPTKAEWTAERNSWGSNQNSTGAFNSPLKLPRASVGGTSIEGNYWSSTVSTPGNSEKLIFTFVNAYEQGSSRSGKASVRCIKN